MITIADRWLAPACMQTCLDALADVPSDKLPASALMSVLQQLPSDLPQRIGCSKWLAHVNTLISGYTEEDEERLPLLKYAITEHAASNAGWLPFVLQQFKRVYLIPAQLGLLQAFLTLPHAAVAAWAGSGQLVVDSENSVAVAIDVWCRGPQGSQCTPQQLKKLAGLVRVAHTTPGVWGS